MQRQPFVIRHNNGGNGLGGDAVIVFKDFQDFTVA